MELFILSCTKMNFKNSDFFYVVSYFIFFILLILISYFINVLLVAYSNLNSFIWDRNLLLLISILLFFCTYYTFKISKSKFKDISLVILFLGLGGSSRHFDLHFIHFFHKLFFLGSILLISYMVYEKIQEKNN